MMRGPSSRIAQVLGNTQDQHRLAELARAIRSAFCARFLDADPAAELVPGSQTAKILGLFLELVPEQRQQAVVGDLVRDIVARGRHLDTGIVGTRYLLEVLTRHGYADLAYEVVTQTTHPGWGYMIEHGATTMWERWERLVTGESNVNSRNHPAFASVDGFFYKVLAGIDIDAAAPGFRRVSIRPYPLGDLSHAQASLDTVRGVVSAAWRRSADTLSLQVALPCNTYGRVCLPKLNLGRVTVRERGKLIWKKRAWVEPVAGITGGVESESHVAFEVGSGGYSFELRGETAVSTAVPAG